MKKIVVYQRTIPPYRRKFFARLAAILTDYNVSLMVATTDGYAKEPDDTGPEYVWLRTVARMDLRGRDIEDTAIFPAGLFRLLRSERPMIAVTEDIAALPGNLAFAVHRCFGGCPYLVWSLGDSILGKRRTWYRAFAYPLIESLRRCADGFICYSSWACDTLAEKYSKPVHVAYNSTISRDDIVEPSESFLSKYDVDGPLKIIYVGRLLAQKKVNLLLEAIAELDDKVELDVIGDGPCRPVLESQARSLGISDLVRFHGAVHESSAKHGLMDAAHLAVLPGLGGLFIQEAYSRGLPVVCGPADGTEQDLVRAVNPKLYLDTVSVSSLVRCLQFLLKDRTLLGGAATAALAITRDKYNLENMVDNWIRAVLAAAPASSES